jgi:hypothetical protein
LFKKQIHKQKWLEENFNQGVDFFNRSWICLKILFIRHSKNNFMDAAEQYAYNIGLIAGKYVKYREQEENSPKSLRDILTYTKYDRDKLRHVYSKVCLGLNLSYLEQDKMRSIREYIGKFKLEEIQDSYTDLSYFFFKGVFENLGVSENES